MTSKSNDETDRQAAAFLGLKSSSVGKTQARQQFLPLVDALGQSARAVEITDHDKPVAVLLSYSHWVALLAKLSMLSKNEPFSSRPNLIGSMQIVGDLKAASKKISNQFQKSIEESAKKL